MLTGYSAEKQKNNVDCSAGDKEPSEACHFNLADLGNACPAPDYGFGEGQPCVLVKLNKVRGLMAEYFLAGCHFKLYAGVFFFEKIYSTYFVLTMIGVYVILLKSGVNNVTLLMLK